MSRPVTIAITQMPCTWDRAANLDQAEANVRAAVAQGANLVLLQELFETPYFCAEQDPAHLDLAAPFDGNPILARFSALAAELNVVLPISFFERTSRNFYNSLAMIDADGTIMGCYRKTHIPDGPGYQEKFFFTPGDTGFRVWDTAVGCVGAGICWDQWFPECARSMALMGAEILLYPTAIGSEPQDPTIQSMSHWQRTMQGHAAANMCVLAASNRVGKEDVGDGLTFYGGSFITDESGEKVAELDNTPGIALASFDLETIRQTRQAWGLFRDRRPEMYGAVQANP